MAGRRTLPVPVLGLLAAVGATACAGSGDEAPRFLVFQDLPPGAVADQVVTDPGELRALLEPLVGVTETDGAVDLVDFGEQVAAIVTPPALCPGDGAARWIVDSVILDGTEARVDLSDVLVGPETVCEPPGVDDLLVVAVPARVTTTRFLVNGATPVTP